MWTAVQEGGGTFSDIAYTDPSLELLAELRANLQVFAAFKNHAEIIDLVAELVDADGNIRSFSDFSEAAQSITNDYNRNWLDAEYSTAIGVAQQAVKWLDIVRDQEILPLLQYQTQEDDRVRESHQLLNGVTLPVDDPFWDQFYPPNSYRCRCFVRQIADGDIVRPDRLPDDTGAPPVFRHNAGKTRELFSAGHPYLATVTDSVQRERIQKAASKFAYDDIDPDTHTAHRYDQESGGWVSIHNERDADQTRRDLQLADVFASAGAQVELLDTRTGNVSALRYWNGNAHLMRFVGNIDPDQSLAYRFSNSATQANKLAYLLEEGVDPSQVVEALSQANETLERKIEFVEIVDPEQQTIQVIQAD